MILIIIFTTLLFWLLSYYIFKIINNKSNIEKSININKKIKIDSWFFIKKSNFKKGKLKIVKNNSHALIVGGSGVGKTQKIIIPFLFLNIHAENKPSFIINDLKGEIQQTLNFYFINQNYNILTLDFDEYDVNKNHFNPLSIIYENKNNEIELKNYIDSVVFFIFNEDNEKDKFWFKKCQEIMIGIIYLMIETNIEKDKFNFETIIDIFLNIEFYKNLIINNFENDSYFYLKDLFLEKNISRTWESIKIIFKSEIIKYNQGLIKKISKYSDFKIDDLLEKNTALFIKNKGNNILINNFISLLINQINIYLLNKKEIKLKRPIINVLDEFSNFSKLENFNSWLSVSRQKNIWYLISIQNISQFEEKYKNIQSYSSNFKFDYFLGNADKNSFDYFVKGYKNKKKDREIDIIDFTKFNTLWYKETIIRIKGYTPKIFKLDYFYKFKNKKYIKKNFSLDLLKEKLLLKNDLDKLKENKKIDNNNLYKKDQNKEINNFLENTNKSKEIILTKDELNSLNKISNLDKINNIDDLIEEIKKNI